VAERKRSTAGILDTAILVFVGLIVAFIALKILAAVFSTVLFFVKLFVVALVIAVVIRAWLWAKRRSRGKAEATPEYPRKAA
jgi:hypothetical protein